MQRKQDKIFLFLISVLSHKDILKPIPHPSNSFLLSLKQSTDSGNRVYWVKMFRAESDWFKKSLTAHFGVWEHLRADIHEQDDNLWKTCSEYQFLHQISSAFEKIHTKTDGSNRKKNENYPKDEKYQIIP